MIEEQLVNAVQNRLLSPGAQSISKILAAVASKMSGAKFSDKENVRGTTPIDKLYEGLDRRNGETLAYTVFTKEEYKKLSKDLFKDCGVDSYDVRKSDNGFMTVFYGSFKMDEMEKVSRAVDAMLGRCSLVSGEALYSMTKDEELAIIENVPDVDAYLAKTIAEGGLTHSDIAGLKKVLENGKYNLTDAETQALKSIIEKKSPGLSEEEFKAVSDIAENHKKQLSRQDFSFMKSLGKVSRNFPFAVKEMDNGLNRIICAGRDADKLIDAMKKAKAAQLTYRGDRIIDAVEKNIGTRSLYESSSWTKRCLEQDAPDKGYIVLDRADPRRCVTFSSRRIGIYERGVQRERYEASAVKDIGRVREMISLMDDPAYVSADDFSVRDIEKWAQQIADDPSLCTAIPAYESDINIDMRDLNKVLEERDLEITEMIDTEYSYLISEVGEYQYDIGDRIDGAVEFDIEEDI